jgi:hypothetical protein
MEHRKDLEDLNKKSMEKLDQYVKMKEKLREEDSDKLHSAKKEWQEAWNKLRGVLIYLEGVEL